MATNYTEHYGLSLWEANDKFYHQEFNENHRKLDTALHGLAAGKADGSETATLRTRVTALEAGRAQIVTGTYIGSGQCGSAHPNTLDFTGVLDRPPKLVIVRPKVACSDGFVLINGITNTMNALGAYSFTDRFNTVSWGGFSVSWYNTVSENYQMNRSDTVYFYIAIS